MGLNKNGSYICSKSKVGSNRQRETVGHSMHDVLSAKAENRAGPQHHSEQFKNRIDARHIIVAPKLGCVTHVQHYLLLRLAVGLLQNVKTLQD